MNVYQVVTQKIIEQLQNNIVPWRKPWNGQKAINYVTRKEYRGINTLLLPHGGEYLTFKQCTELGGKIKKGSKSFMIVFYTWCDKKDNKDNKDNNTEEVKKIPILKYYNVFHITQCEGIESKLTNIELNENIKPIDDSENLINEYINREGIELNKIVGDDSAYYVPSTDTINVPSINQFVNVNEYYSTIFHEMVHSTGHEKRLDRFSKQKNHTFGSMDYSKEELVAEIGASMLMSIKGLEVNESFNNSISYIHGWLKALQDDSKLIVFASSQAQKASDYILGIKQTEITEIE